MEVTRTRISLGPLRYYWPQQRVRDFYDQVATSPVDDVYLGEVVCGRRHELHPEDWLEIARSLACAGKRVVLSTQGLIESEGDLQRLRRLVEHNDAFLVEANDFAAVSLLAATGRPFVAGASLNVYNHHSLAQLARLGARRWVVPHDMSARELQVLRQRAEVHIEAELFVHGRLPLAHSARCFTARRFGLQKDKCEYRCAEFPGGLPLLTQSGEEFLGLNGTQTQSALCYDLLSQAGWMREARMDLVRISPEPEGTLEAVTRWRSCLDGATPVPAAGPGQPGCNGFFFGRPGLAQVAS